MRKPLVVAAVVLGVSLSAGVAWSAIPHSATGSITGCYSKNTGVLRVIDKQANKKCKSYERELAWQQAGAQGPAGPPGSPGGAGASYHVADANGTDLGVLVRAPDDDSAPIPGDPVEFMPGRSVVVRRADGTFAEYDAGNGAVPRHGELLYFTANCSGPAYVRVADLTTATSFYGIPPLEVDSIGNPVRGLTVSGPLVEPTGGHALLGARTLGEAGCNDLSAFPRIGQENSVKLAATAAYMPVNVPGPLHIVAP